MSENPLKLVPFRTAPDQITEPRILSTCRLQMATFHVEMSKFDHIWTKKNLARLGTASDSLLGGVLRVPTAEVRARRNALGIPKFDGHEYRPHDWVDEDIKLLGTISDSAVAGKIGASFLQVVQERRNRKIAPFEPRIKKHVWTPEQDAMLGVEFDSSVATKLGITVRTVRLRRDELGIARQNTSGKVKGGFVRRSEEEIWTADAIAMLGKISDALLARNLRIPSSAARAKREELGIPRYVMKHPHTREWSAEEIALIGTMSDADVAKVLAISRGPVAVRRKAMGIPCFIKKKERTWLPEEDAMLGVKRDLEVAALLGITAKIVGARRNKLGIPRQYGNSARARG